MTLFTINLSNPVTSFLPFFFYFLSKINEKWQQVYCKVLVCKGRQRMLKFAKIKHFTMYVTKYSQKITKIFSQYPHFIFLRETATIFISNLREATCIKHTENIYSVKISKEYVMSKCQYRLISNFSTQSRDMTIDAIFFIF